jgi:hypothetical protein
LMTPTQISTIRMSKELLMQKIIWELTVEKWCLQHCNGDWIQYEPNCKRKRECYIFSFRCKEPYFTAGCVAIDENNMKSIVNG